MTVDAADNGRVPTQLALNGTLGRAVTGGDDVTLDYVDSRKDHWPSVRAQASSMARAVNDVVASLDDPSIVFSYHASAALRTLEAIVAFHISNEKAAGWVELPLAASERGLQVHSG